LHKGTIPGDVLLFSSIIYRDEGPLHKAMDMLGSQFGPELFRSDHMAFDYTSYYEREFGSPLSRVFVAFERLVPRDCLVDAKTATNSIEDSLKVGGRRSVNIDPGIISLENIILATTKPYSHRVYLGKGIWCEVTLIYEKNTYSPLKWSYPDYSSDKIIAMFNTLRGEYRKRFK